MKHPLPSPRVITPDDVMPDPKVWPVCAECHSPYALRLAIVFGANAHRWLWSRDCKHKTAAAIVHNADGPVPS